MKVLNLYAGIGGNRKLWQDVEVTAVEHNEEIAAIYKDYFPDDKMVIADAHEYLLKHYKEYVIKPVRPDSEIKERIFDAVCDYFSIGKHELLDIKQEIQGID